MHTLSGLFVYAPHELQQQAFLDDVVAIYSGRDALHQPRIDVV